MGLSASLDIWGLWYAFCGSLWKSCIYCTLKRKVHPQRILWYSPAFVFLGVKKDSWEFRIFQNTLFHLQPLGLFSVFGVSKYVFDETIEYHLDCSRKFSWLWLHANSHAFTICSEFNFLTSQKCSLTYCFCIIPSMKAYIFGYCVIVFFLWKLDGKVNGSLLALVSFSLNTYKEMYLTFLKPPELLAFNSTSMSTKT